MKGVVYTINQLFVGGSTNNIQRLRIIVLLHVH